MPAANGHAKCGVSHTAWVAIRRRCQRLLSKQNCRGGVCPPTQKQSIVISTVWEISPKTQETRSLVALLSAKLLTLGIIQVYLILHSLIRNIGSVGMTIRIKETYHYNCRGGVCPPTQKPKLSYRPHGRYLQYVENEIPHTCFGMTHE